MTCCGACLRLFESTPKPTYLSGKVWCKECESSFFYEGIFCPCCGKRVRKKSRHTGKRQKDYERL